MTRMQASEPSGGRVAQLTRVLRGARFPRLVQAARGRHASCQRRRKIEPDTLLSVILGGLLLGILAAIFFADLV